MKYMCHMHLHLGLKKLTLNSGSISNLISAFFSPRLKVFFKLQVPVHAIMCKQTLVGQFKGVATIEATTSVKVSAPA